MNWKTRPGRKHLFILAVCVGLASCAAMKPAYEREFDEFALAVENYDKSVNDADSRNTNADEAYFGDLLSIATKFHQDHLARLYRMMQREATLKRQVLPNIYAQIKPRYDAGDKTLISEAEAYQVNISARDKCSSFGFVSGTPEFNKCVYDYKVQYAQLLMQQQQVLMQMARPAPIRLPTTTQTNCVNTWGGGIQCKSTGY